MRLARFIALLFVLLTGNSHATEPLTIAVASNFQATAAEIAAQFTAGSNISVRISSGSTGSLYTRIVNGAPYDIFLAADTVRPQLLEKDGHAIAESSFVYATGRLVLWSADLRFEGRECNKDLANGTFKYLAIANPETAPYGRAAKDYLLSRELWSGVAGKLVVGENVAQAFQFVATGNATLGLIAASQVSGALAPASTCFEEIGGSTERSFDVDQGAVILAASQNLAAAEKFMHFLQSPAIGELLVRRGYRIKTIASH